ncbi:MAG: DUF3450 domain-containing protein [Panacagrimonas sp.]
MIVFPKWKAVAARMLGLSLAVAVPCAPAQDAAGKALDAVVDGNRAARTSQQRVDSLDDQTKSMLERYRAASWQAQQLTVYAKQLGELVSAQEGERSSIERQITEMERTERELLPLMLRMVEGLEKFIALDLPFLATERRERLDTLKKLMSDPEANNAEKFKRLLEAWQIESEYGRSIGTERAEVEGRTVDVLRLGRTALYYLSADGKQAGTWNSSSGAWEALPHQHVAQVRHGLRMARETAAPDLLRLPVAAAAAAGAAP